MTALLVIAGGVAYLWVGCVAGVFLGKLAYRRARAANLRHYATLDPTPTADDFVFVAAGAVFFWPLVLPVVLVFVLITGEVEADHEAVL